MGIASQPCFKLPLPLCYAQVCADPSLGRCYMYCSLPLWQAFLLADACRRCQALGLPGYSASRGFASHCSLKPPLPVRMGMGRPALLPPDVRAVTILSVRPFCLQMPVWTARLSAYQAIPHNVEAFQVILAMSRLCQRVWVWADQLCSLHSCALWLSSLGGHYARTCLCRLPSYWPSSVLPQHADGMRAVRGSPADLLQPLTFWQSAA